MTTLSRRSFLQLSGLALAASTLHTPLWSALAQPAPVHGRVLMPATVSDAARRATRQLWPDSVVGILDADERRYRLRDGWVERAAVQPMTPVQSAARWPALPCLVEVGGPVAPVRRACGAEAALVTRIGHGGVLHVLDVMRDERGMVAWLAVGPQPDALLGWTPAQHWQPVAPELPAAGPRQLRIGAGSGTLYAFENDEVIAAAPVSVGPHTPKGESVRVRGRQPCTQWVNGAPTLSGVPWALHLGDGSLLAGAYWHNQFGAPVSGPALQVAPAFARWLYAWLPDGADVSFG